MQSHLPLRLWRLSGGRLLAFPKGRLVGGALQQPCRSKALIRLFHAKVPALGAPHAVLGEDDMIDSVNSFGSASYTASKTEESFEREPKAAEGTFASVPALSAPTLKALHSDFKYTAMSSVQEAVLSLLPTEKDLLVRAKTGTGKTLAFLIAALESAIARRRGRRFDEKSVTVLVLSPTRELALQITEEAKRLLAPHRYRVATAVGGPGRNRFISLIKSRQRTDVLIATPGRLLDMLENVPEFQSKCQGLETLIFDEADQLLEMGFRDSISAIVDKLPSQRQTFMFSATLSPGIQAIAKKTLQPGYDYIDTVPANETPTHLKVRQTYAVLPYSQQLPILYDIIHQHRQSNPAAKIIVFFPTTKVVSYLAGVFNDIPGMDIMEIHSKLTQMHRTRVAQRFRRAHSAVLFTSDVSARGVDYPGVTLVVQMGVPSSSDQYIHRVGRTGRAGASGEGIIILSPYEKRFLDGLKDVPIKQDMRYGPQAPAARNEEVKQLLGEAMRHAPKDMAMECYSAYIGFHKQNAALLGVSKETMIKGANDFATGVLGLASPPSIGRSFAANLGILRVRGVNLRE
ncbi:hypothetical protein SpCBS45565_g00217 [Spizellomyces sp. 'palustris']|nr:hypothetical protein SpCBS45565_g00217 [Spizellomyces sp. 'palustris']